MAEKLNNSKEAALDALENPYDKAWKYLSKQNILQLFQVVHTIVFLKKIN